LQTFKRAKEQDLDQICDLIRNTTFELELSDKFPENRSKIREVIRENLAKGVILTYDNCGIIKGVLALGVSYFWWSDQPYLTNTVFYVRPEERPNRVAEKLLKYAKETCETLGVPLVLNFMDTTENLERKALFASKKTGYKTAGITLL
jgi:N-acetylglutamate synthase-like GNAT family acetyltransferase